MQDYCKRIVAIITEYETLSEGHVRWFTHKNPYGCWICDLLQTFREFTGELMLENQYEDPESFEETDSSESSVESVVNDLEDK